MFSFFKQKKELFCRFPPGGAFAHKKKLFVRATRKSKLTVRPSKETSYLDLKFYFFLSFFLFCFFSTGTQNVDLFA